MKIEIDTKELKGNIKSFTETKKRIPFSRDFTQSTYYLDENGNITNEGMMVKRVGMISPLSRQFCKYNEDGNIIEHSNGKESGRFYSRTVHKYNIFKQLVSSTEFNISGEIVQERIWTYLNDHSNMLAALTTVNKNGKFITDFKENRKDNTSPIGTGNKSTLKRDVVVREEFEYDEIGNWTKKTVFEDDKKILEYERKYSYNDTSK